MGPDYIPNLKRWSDFNSNFVNILISGIDTVKWVDVADIKKITVYRFFKSF
jgi:hypothetical protein